MRVDRALLPLSALLGEARASLVAFARIGSTRFAAAAEAGVAWLQRFEQLREDQDASP